MADADGKDQNKEQKKEHKNNRKKEEKFNLGKWCRDKYVEYVSEFRKIVWPSRNDLMKQTVTVIVISLIFGVFIAALDGAFGSVFRQLVLMFA